MCVLFVSLIVMDIQSTKIELVKLILSIDNPKLIQGLADYISSETADFWLELSDTDQQEIQLGIDQLDQGKRTNLDDFLKKVS
ncbi:MAG: hypothetical protein ACI9J3_004118 [Parvicellaceae bacterium]